MRYALSSASRLRPPRNSARPSSMYSRRASGSSLDGSSMPSTKRASAVRTPTRSARPNGPSIGRAYAGTCSPIAAMIASVRSGSAGRSAAASVGGRSADICRQPTDSKRTDVAIALPPRQPVSYAQYMSKTARIVNLLAVVLPPIVIAAAIVVFWNDVVGLHDLALLAAMYVLTGFGVTVGFHRMLTHRSFRTSKPVEYFFAAAGSMAVQGPVINWVADHRKHHAHTDEEGDPHSPHVGRGAGLLGAVRGLLHAHVGWLVSDHGKAERSRYARDLTEDPGMRAINRSFLWIVGLGLALPALVGYVITGRLSGALTGLLWGGLVRIFLLHHVTWSINSICHFFGRRRFAVGDHSTNVWWLALPSFGEAWHHNHHTFPRSAQRGLSKVESTLDPSAWLIAAMEKLGLARDVVRITPERQREKLAEGT